MQSRSCKDHLQDGTALRICSSMHLAAMIGCNNMLMLKQYDNAKSLQHLYFILLQHILYACADAISSR